MINVTGLIYVDTRCYGRFLFNEFLYWTADHPYLIEYYFDDDNEDLQVKLVYLKDIYVYSNHRQYLEQMLDDNYARMAKEIGCQSVKDVIRLYFTRKITSGDKLTIGDVINEIGTKEKLMDYIYGDPYLKKKYIQGPTKQQNLRKRIRNDLSEIEQELDKHIGSFKFFVRREPENTNKDTFDFIHVELGICGCNIDKRKWCKKHAKDIVKYTTDKMSNQVKYSRYGIPVNFLRCTNAVYRVDDVLQLVFELKKIS